MVATELFQECAMYEIVVDQVGRPGDPYCDSTLRKLGGQVAEGL